VGSGLAAEQGYIFISYRRDDARGASGRVWDWLRIGFGPERVFRDVASIGAGKWRQKIEQALAASKACVAVIGRRWADATNLPRLQDPNDMVRHELETALASGDREALTVIPLLVEDAQLANIPTVELPESLRPLLADWNVLSLSERGWDDDTRRLIEAIAAATGLPVNPELDEWMALMTGAQQVLSMARGIEAAGAVWRQGEEQALESLLHCAAGADPEERPALKAALAALAGGNTLLAEESFEQEVTASRRLRLAAEHLATNEGRREADAARNVASLAVVRGDLSKAIRYFLMALEANPKDLDAALQLGYAWISRGELTQASTVFTAAIQQARDSNDPRMEGCALNGNGDVLVVQGDSAGALAAYQTGLMIREDLAKLDPVNMEWQRDLFVSKTKIGDVLVAQGDGAGALATYQSGLTIAEGLAKRDPANTQWQRDLSVSNIKIGDLLLAQGDGAGALTAYQADLRIAEGLAKRDPANTQWQRDLFVSEVKIGDVLVAQGDAAGALAAFQVGLTIAEGLAKHDPANTEWQRDLSVINNKIGDLLLAQGDGAGALAAYQAGLKIAEGLATHDPLNTEWQRDLSVSNTKIGDVLLAQGNGPGALAAYQADLKIAESLAKRDPANTQWQRDLSVSNNKIGDVLVAQGDGPGALAAYQAGLTIAEGLAKRDPANSQWQRDLSVSNNKIGDVLVAQGDGPGALGAYQAGLTIAEGLAKRDPANTQWQVDVAVSCAKLGSLDSLVSMQQRKEYLSRGLELLSALKQAGRLHPNQDWTSWFNNALRSLK
jgi:predicted negative regulator of RcsB-dependent stress response